MFPVEECLGLGGALGGVGVLQQGVVELGLAAKGGGDQVGYVAVAQQVCCCWVRVSLSVGVEWLGG